MGFSLPAEVYPVTEEEDDFLWIANQRDFLASQ